MRAPRMMDISQLRALFRYDAQTGHLYKRTMPERRAEHAYEHSNYLHVRIGSQVLAAHRVAYALHYGQNPVGLVDHINGDTTDNRARNLRSVSFAENMHNAPRYKKGKRKPVLAVIGPPGDRVVLGEFDTIEDARAYRTAIFNRALDELYANDA